MNTRHLRAEDLRGRRWRGLVRESTEAQAEQWSPERQRADLRRAADELGLVAVEPEFYLRVGSGEAEQVPELEQALAEGKRGDYDVLLVIHTSRFARNRAEAVRAKAAFAKAGIVIYFVAQRIVSGAFASGLAEGINEVIDEHSNEERRFWIAGGLRERQHAGRWIGNVPFGYRKEMADRPDGSRGWSGGLEPDPIEGPIVRGMFASYVTGLSPRDIAHSLNIAGKRSRRGELWTGSTIYKILANPIYSGTLHRYRRQGGHYYDEADPHDGRREMPAPWTSPVEPALAEEVGRLLGARSPSASAGPRMSYPLSRVLRCTCGRRMTGAHGGNGRRYYRCSNRTLTGACRAPAIRADDAEEEFAQWLGKFRLPEDWRLRIAALPTGDHQEAADRRARLEGQVERLKKQYAWGDLTDDAYRAEMARLRGELGQVVEPATASLVAVAEALARLGDAWRTTPNVAARNVTPDLLLREIIVRDGKVAEVVIRAELRPLLALCVPHRPYQEIRSIKYTERYSA